MKTKLSKMSMRDKRILLMLLGIVVFVLGYFLVFQPQMAKAEEIEAQNVPLREKLNQLKEIEENQDYYISETNKYNQRVSDYTNMFPADVKEEDAVLLGKGMEDKLGLWIFKMDFADQEFVASLDTSGLSNGSEGDDSTLSEQANQPTQDQINEIEGTAETESDASAVPDGIDLDSVALYRVKNTMEFNGTYQELKDLVDYLAADASRLTIDSMDIDFSASTGDLGGTVVVNMYSMTGTGRTYTTPDISSVVLGNHNLFGTLTTSSRKNSDNSGSHSSGSSTDNSSSNDSNDGGSSDNSDNTQ